VGGGGGGAPVGDGGGWVVTGAVTGVASTTTGCVGVGGGSGAVGVDGAGAGEALSAGADPVEIAGRSAIAKPAIIPSIAVVEAPTVMILAERAGGTRRSRLAGSGADCVSAGSATTPGSDAAVRGADSGAPCGWRRAARRANRSAAWADGAVVPG
jgi:hypothetical protein